MTRITDAEDL